MSESIITQVAPIVNIGGIELTETGVVFNSPPTERQLSESISFVHRMRKAIDWCTGDVTGAWLRFIMQRDKQEGINVPPEHTRQMELQHIAEFAEAQGLHKDIVAENELLSRFYPAEARVSELSFAHHVEAYAASDGELSAAVELLSLALTNAWTVAEFRRYNRANKATKSNEEIESSLDAIDRKLSEIELWAAKRLRKANEITPSAAHEMLLGMRRTVELVDILRSRSRSGA